MSKAVLFAIAVGNKTVHCIADMKWLRFVEPEERDDLIAFSRTVGLLANYEPFCLGETGRQVTESYLKKRSCENPFRILLASFIRTKLPTWAWRIPSGRLETVNVLPVAVTDCFHAAGLLKSELDEETVHWWLEMASFIRGKLGDEKAETGIKGETLSIQYETARTGRKPQWVSFESNFAGYDLISVVSSGCDKQRLIEVKASTKPVESATFFVSANEWGVALTRLDSYYFHLWLLSNSPMLTIVSAKAIMPHIPQNRSLGIWQSVEIPFSVFFDNDKSLIWR